MQISRFSVFRERIPIFWLMQKIEDLLGDPDITFNTKSSIDLTSLSQAFPLQPGVTLGGKVDADLNLQCRLSALQKQDLGRLKLKGKLDMKQMVLKEYDA